MKNQNLTLQQIINQVKSLFISLLLCIICIFALTACAGPTQNTEPPQSSNNREGLDSRFSPESQRLFARARLMWNINEKCSDPALAMEHLDVVIAMEPAYADAYMRRALAASELRYWDEAFNDSSTAIRMEQKADNYAYRALIFMREGNYLGARKDLEKALRLDSTNIKAKAFLQELNALEQ